MATRSLIGYVTEEGSVRYNYCHFDGYPNGVGKELLRKYNTAEAVEALIQYEIRSLNHEGEVEYFEEDVSMSDAPRTSPDAEFFLKDFSYFGTDFHYLLTDEGWLISSESEDIEYLEDVLSPAHLQEIILDATGILVSQEEV